jgi:hypothetical protein
MLRSLVAVCVFASALFAQRNVSPANMYHRVRAVVPLIGAGTTSDPRRPMLVPTPAEQVADAANGGRPDLIGYTMQLSDDGQYALVEFVIPDPMAFERLLVKAMAKIPGSDTLATRTLPSIARDGSNAGSIAASIAARKAALESVVPGLKLFERGKSTEAEILTEFRKRKANFDLQSLRSVQ